MGINENFEPDFTIYDMITKEHLRMFEHTKQGYNIFVSYVFIMIIIYEKRVFH